MEFSPFNELLKLLPPGAMRSAARHYRILALELDTAADRLDGAALHRKERHARVEKINRAASCAAQSIVAHGEGRTQAIEAAASEEGIEPAAVAVALPCASRTARAARDEGVRRLALANWSNAEIGARMKLHPGSVSRIIGRLRRRGTLVALKGAAETGTTA